MKTYMLVHSLEAWGGHRRVLGDLEVSLIFIKRKSIGGLPGAGNTETDFHHWHHSLNQGINRGVPDYVQFILKVDRLHAKDGQ